MRGGIAGHERGDVHAGGCDGRRSSDGNAGPDAHTVVSGWAGDRGGDFCGEPVVVDGLM